MSSSEVTNKPMGPLVSVIMPCYKMGQFIGEALESVGNQTYNKWEIIAVDDCGPEDRTREYLTEFARQYPKYRVELIRHEENSGVSAARNTCIKASRGEVLAFLDPDDIWKSDHLERCVGVLTSFPDVQVVTGSVVYFDENDLETGQLNSIQEWEKECFPASLACHNFIQPSATILYRHLFDKVGFFETDPGLQHIEDYDMWIRLADAGCNFHFLDGASCYYRKHADAATSDFAKMKELHRNLYDKHMLFFIQMLGQLLHRSSRFANQSHLAITGPIFRLAIHLDKFIRGFKKRFIRTR